MEDNSVRVNAGNNMYKDIQFLKSLLVFRNFAHLRYFIMHTHMQIIYFEIFEDKRFKYKSVSPQC